MKRIIFHIGTAKTGTTAIQHFLSENTDQLARRGLYYGRFDRPPSPKRPKHNSLYEAAKGDNDEAFEAERKAIIADFERSGLDVLVLSEEGLSSPNRNIPRYCARFADNYLITVVCMFRRQDFFLEALWNQKAKEGKYSGNIVDFINRDFHKARLSYATILNQWSSFAEVRAASFEDAKREGIIKTFANLASIELDGEANNRNQSPGMQCSLFLTYMNRNEQPYRKLRLIKAFEGLDTKYALGSKLRKKILRSVKGQNAVLSRQYGVTFNDYLPDEPKEPLVEPDLEVLARALHSMLQ